MVTSWTIVSFGILQLKIVSECERRKLNIIAYRIVKKKDKRVFTLNVMV